jgi:hypothetical protein
MLSLERWPKTRLSQAGPRRILARGYNSRNAFQLLLSRFDSFSETASLGLPTAHLRYCARHTDEHGWILA